jgi:hypothetical protein
MRFLRATFKIWSSYSLYWRLITVLWFLSIPYIYYISSQPQRNEIEQWMIVAFLIGGCILAVEAIISINRIVIKQISPDFPFPTNNRLMRLAGVTFLMCVVGFTILLYISSPFKF